MKKSLFGWCEFISGIFLLGMGAYALFSPSSLLWGSMILYGVMAIVVGASDLLLSMRIDKEDSGRTWLLAAGIANLVIGAVMLFGAGAGAGAVPYLLLVAIIVHGLARLLAMNTIGKMSDNKQKNVTLWCNIIATVSAVIPFFVAAGTFWAALALLILSLDSLMLSFSPVAAPEEGKKTAAA